MILQALSQYYERKAMDPDTALAPEGFEQKEIPFLFVIDHDGGFVQIEDTRSGDGKARRARTFQVPQGVKKASGVAANLLWDNAEYALGLQSIRFLDKLQNEQDEAKRKAIRQRLLDQHSAYKKRLVFLPASDEGIIAVQAFLSAVPFETLQKAEAWKEIVETNPVVTFRLISDEHLTCQRPSLIRFLQSADSTEPGKVGRCLVSGETGIIERLHPSIQGVWGAQSSGANIVSFNQRSFESYGKEQRQGENAPIGQKAVFAYTTALRHLLGKGSNQRVQVGDASTVFWADRPCELEQSFNSFWSEPPKDDPDRCVKAVEALYRSVSAGTAASLAEPTRFFVLGLAPNAARISVRFWIQGTVEQFGGVLLQHFKDLDICRGPNEKPYLPLFRLLVSIASQGKADNVQPNIAGETMRAILAGLPYPATLFQACIRRIRAEQTVSYPRAALLKACINRRNRYRNPNCDEELKVSLDINNPHAGYRLGRLFAVLEKIQEEASPGLNATIRDRFYGAASATPVTVFPNLMKLSKHHLAKIENRGRMINLERWTGEIMDGLNEFPRLLTIDDQGRFAIGYYHQRQAFFAKKLDQEGQL